MEIFTNHNRKPSLTGWQSHQSLFQRTRNRNTLFRKGTRLGIIMLVIVLGIYSLIQGFGWMIASGQGASETAATTSANEVPGANDKQVAQQLLQEIPLHNLKDTTVQVTRQDTTLHLDTSIDSSLQDYMLGKLDRKNSRYIALVALDPVGGEILMMAGYDKIDPDNNTCLDNTYPAASIFKIVTAAAAAEQQNLDSNSKLRFNGSQHTLYKNQLKDRKNRYTNHTTLQEAFAKSINPVFGKLGALSLEKEDLSAYAEAFGFNSEIDFELPLLASRFSITDTPYHRAEIASGFNRQTTLSAVHAALLPAVILNQGKRVEPTIVQRITDDSGRLLYETSPGPMRQVITPRTSRVLYDLMEATVRYGTAKKAFSGFHKDPVLSKCNLGGKTGSIYNRKHDLRFDWFVGFADLKNGDKKMAISVVVAHEEFIGIRAAAYARMAIKKYYTDFLKSG
ncbi:MAG: PbpA [Deltaproteobacteria bacterium]|jgi:cell division protein FtsI/penicillin-binding protein 2|nr:PbpA [Deltaproteobacteria bacterium]